jgi:hypothetical protein
MPDRADEGSGSSVGTCVRICDGMSVRTGDLGIRLD